MGIEAYGRRDREHAPAPEQAAAPEPTPASAAAPETAPASAPASAPGAAPETAPASTPTPTPPNMPADAWQTLKQEVSTCRRCPLCETRTQTVFGVGAENADWMLIGEAPGSEEDRRGEPFVGRAGQLLDRMLKAIGFAREEVYIANVVKCRPPDNRNPAPEEVLQCDNYLRRQIELIRPQIIIALGGVAMSALLNEQTPVGKMRGRVHTLPGADIPVVVTYHPAYLLRAPTQKRAAWEDLQLACRTVGRELA
ncbi:MAG: uracil-DNA glycosylase [Gammaproteobacteria bacterium]|nr:uracil-DNA glycosylase [Gammaproteobacteria bacterium]